MDILSSLAIIALAALIHASFQLSVSVLTLLSGHSLSAGHSHARLLRLTGSFLGGTMLMTLLLVSFVALLMIDIFGPNIPQIVWAAACGVMLGVALSVWLFYYRREKGTTLWIPRDFADYLNERIKSTKQSAEAFGLGMGSVISEILFIIAPLLVGALTLIQLPPAWQLVGIAIYTIVSSLSIIIVWMLIGGGHNLSRIQKWREENKYFMQFAAGLGLIVLVFFVYVYEILNSTVGVLQ